jgi:hypothetical protein
MNNVIDIDSSLEWTVVVLCASGNQQRLEVEFGPFTTLLELKVQASNVRY